MDPQKQCGECTACCSLMAIVELQKPHFVKCQNLCKAGCAIYKDRPQTCREYECLWKSNAIIGDEKYRPDVLGVLFHPTEIDGMNVIELWETKLGASNNRQVQRILKKLLKSGEFQDYQVVSANQTPSTSMDKQLLFRKVKGTWRFHQLVDS